MLTKTEPVLIAGDMYDGGIGITFHPDQDKGKL
jgi:hypothetical protein